MKKVEENSPKRRLSSASSKKVKPTVGFEKYRDSIRQDSISKDTVNGGVPTKVLEILSEIFYSIEAQIDQLNFYPACFPAVTGSSFSIATTIFKS